MDDDNNEKFKYPKDVVVDTDLENKELSEPKHMEVEDDDNEQSPPHSEPEEGTKEAENRYNSSSTWDDDDPKNSFEIVNSTHLGPGDSDSNHHVVVKGPKEGIDVAVETGTTDTTICEEPPNNANAEKLDGPNVDHPFQPDYDAIPCERSVETKPEDDEAVEELKSDMENKAKENELTNRVASDSETKEEEEEEEEEELLNNGVNGMDLPPKRERKEDVFNNTKNEGKEEVVNNGMARMKLPPSKEELNIGVTTGMEELLADNEIKEELTKPGLEVVAVGHVGEMKSPSKSFLLDPIDGGIDESGTEEEQVAFIKELETFHRERCLEFKAPRFYGEPLNCLKLWRAVIRLGGYEQVTSCKLWRQVGESFKPPKTCTTVSWTFRCFYEKALLEYEKHKMQCGELPFSDASFTGPITPGNQMQVGDNQSLGSGRARRDAAARAMQGWHSQRLLGNGEVGDPIIKDKNSISTPKREKQLKSVGLLKRKKPSPVERAIKVARLKASKPQLDSVVVDIGPPADWVKINVQRTKDCFEVYALVPGLLREEVRVQSDPAGRLVISGQPEQVDNPWGVTHFKKVVSLPSRIDPHQTSAVVTLHGQLFVRVPFEQSDV